MLHPDWTRITACSVEFQRQHFFVNSRKCRMLLLNSSWVGGSGTMRHHSFKNCIGFPCPNVTSSKQFCWYTKHCKETALRICRICWSPTRVTEMEWCQQMTSLVSMSPLLNTKLLVIMLSACLAPKCGICYLRTSGCPLQLLHSKLPLKPIFFKLHIRNYFFRHILFHLNAYYMNWYFDDWYFNCNWLCSLWY